jgi:hypothetical protein
VQVSAGTGEWTERTAGTIGISLLERLERLEQLEQQFFDNPRTRQFADHDHGSYPIILYPFAFIL